MNNLKPCPFCGGEATIYESQKECTKDGLFIAHYKAGCDNCKIYFSHNSEFILENGQPKFYRNGYEFVINAWNRRLGQKNKEDDPWK